MPIIPWRPFWDLERWFEEHPFFSPHRFARDFEEEWPEMWERPSFRLPMLRAPRMDISETDKEVIAEVELPGVDLKDIEVQVKNNILKVEAKTKKKEEEKKKGYYRKEISAGFYKRAVPLPVEVIGEKAKADYEDGMLRISIPKKEKTKKKVKPIKVKVKKSKKE
jgi:HSP20 family protein